MGKNYSWIILILFSLCFGGYAESFDKGSYFPEGTFPDDRGERYSEILKTLEEPSVKVTANEGDMYRFLFVHAFDDVLAVRVQGGGSDPYVLHGIIYTKISSTDQEISRVEKVLTSHEFEEIKNLLQKSKFWRKPVDWRFKWYVRMLRWISIVPQSQVDGSQWIMEVKEGSQYHVVDEWSGGQNKHYRTLCRYFVELAELKSPEIREHLYFDNIAGLDKYEMEQMEK